jgi:hypothetical protein
MALGILRDNAIETINTPAEMITNHIIQGFDNSTNNLDVKHAIDVVSGDIETFDECMTVQVRTLPQIIEPTGRVKVKLERDEDGFVSISRYCEFSNVRAGLRVGNMYPQVYFFCQWDSKKPLKSPAWFFIVDTKEFYAKAIIPMVMAIGGDTHAEQDLALQNVYPKTGGRDGSFWYNENTSEIGFSLLALKRTGVSYYLYPARKDCAEDRQWRLI